MGSSRAIGARAAACLAGLALAAAGAGCAWAVASQAAASVAEVQGAAMRAAYTDVAQGDWWTPYVAYVTGRGVMSDEDGDGAFGVRAQATRAEVVSALWRMAGSPAAEYGGEFADVALGDEAATALAWALSAGVVSAPDAQGASFRPTDPATREEAASLVARYAGGAGKAASGDLSAFPDGTEASPWAVDALSWCVGNGLLSSESDTGLLKPAGAVTRAQLAKMLTVASTLDRRAHATPAQAQATDGTTAQAEASEPAGAAATVPAAQDATSQSASNSQGLGAAGSASAPTTNSQDSGSTSYDAAPQPSSGGASYDSNGSSNSSSSGGSSGQASQPRWVVDQAAYDEQVMTSAAWDEQVMTSAAWDEQVMTCEAWDEQVLVSDAWDEEVATGHWYYYFYEDGFRADTSDELAEHAKYLIKNNINAHYTSYPEYQTVHHDAEYTTVHHDAEYQTVHHDAVYTTVHHDAVYTTVHHDEVGHWE